MTLKKHDGSWSPARVTLFCTVVATVFTGFMALPMMIEYGGKAVAPWTTLPRDIAEIKQDVKAIADKLNAEPIAREDLYTTNRTMRTANKSKNQINE